MSAVVATLIKGGPVMIPLLLCSLVAVAVVLERAWFWWSERGRGVGDRIVELSAGGKWDDALHTAGASRSALARVLVAGIQSREVAPALAMESAARDEGARMRRSLHVLDTIITLSPLLGLLGTVTGMISAFGVMSASGMSEPHAITGGVAEALIATACGLGVAIAALVPYNLFAVRRERALDEIERYGTRLEAVIRGAAS